MWIEFRVGEIQVEFRVEIQSFEYSNYCIDSSQILHKYKDHQIPFVAASNKHMTNPRWWTTPIFQKLINRRISTMVQPTATKFGTVMPAVTLNPSPVKYELLKIENKTTKL